MKFGHSELSLIIQFPVQFQSIRDLFFSNTFNDTCVIQTSFKHLSLWMHLEIKVLSFLKNLFPLLCSHVP